MEGPATATTYIVYLDRITLLGLGWTVGRPIRRVNLKLLGRCALVSRDDDSDSDDDEPGQPVEEFHWIRKRLNGLA
jgi:hypothetical protein